MENLLQQAAKEGAAFDEQEMEILKGIVLAILESEKWFPVMAQKLNSDDDCLLAVKTDIKNGVGHYVVTKYEDNNSMLFFWFSKNRIDHFAMSLAKEMIPEVRGRS